MHRSIIISTICLYMFAACKTTSSHKPSTTSETLSAPDTLLAQKQRRGVDFFAEGNEPVAWTLEIDFAKGFSFKPSDGRSLITSPAQVQRDASVNTDIYETKTDIGLMKIIIYDESCIGKQQNIKKITITLNDKRYQGCGNYLYDEQINNAWSLENIDNRNPSIPVKNLPWIELNLLKNKMNGYDGCNTISSAIRIQGNRIKFAAFSKTKRACPDNEAERLFSTMLSDHEVDYYIKDGRLVIVLLNEIKLIFIKKE